MPDKATNKNNISELLKILNSKNINDRVMAIRILGETGDELALEQLRKRMGGVSKEMEALIIAIGKLKRRLGVK